MMYSKTKKAGGTRTAYPNFLPSGSNRYAEPLVASASCLLSCLFRYDLRTFQQRPLNGRVEQRQARKAHNLEVAGSSPVSATRSPFV